MFSFLSSLLYVKISYDEKTQILRGRILAEGLGVTIISLFHCFAVLGSWGSNPEPRVFWAHTVLLSYILSTTICGATLFLFALWPLILYFLYSFNFFKIIRWATFCTRHYSGTTSLPRYRYCYSHFTDKESDAWELTLLLTSLVRFPLLWQKYLR